MMNKNDRLTIAPADTTQRIVSEIKELLQQSRRKVSAQVNQEILSTYWKIGEIIVRYEQNDQIRAAYGEKTLLQLSKVLTKELGKGFSRSNLQNMRLFYSSYPKCQTVSGKLSWSHYCELLSIFDKDKRSFYEKESENAGWSVRELKRQTASSLFERLLLSRGDANKEQILSLARQGVEYSKPEKVIRDSYVFEFLGVPENKPMPEAVGQLNMYLNYYAAEVNDMDDNPPIGIILCTDKDNLDAEYALGGLSNQIFASKYVLYMPDREQLIQQVEDVLKRWNEREEEDGQ